MTYSAKRTNVLVGVHFAGDNDFHTTIRAFLQLFIDSRFITDPSSMTKARIVELFHMLAPGLYLLCQNGYQYGTSDKWQHTYDYLKIEEKNIFIGEECITKYIELSTSGQGNYDYYYVDIDQREIFSM